MKFKLIEDLPERKYKYYNNGEITKRFKIGDPIPDGWIEGHLSLKGKQSWNKGLTAETDPRVKANGQATRATRLATDNYHAWNKGLTKETDPRMKKASDNHKGCTAWNKGLSIPGHPHSDESKEKIRKAHLDSDFQERRYQQMKLNGTLYVNASKAEEEVYKNLCTINSTEDIIRQYFDKIRYPFKCDFYIISEDKFIEVHANWTHGGKPYDPNDAECREKLEIWTERAKYSEYYQNAIYTWTDLDVRKLETAKNNNLNFEAIY